MMYENIVLLIEFFTRGTVFQVMSSLLTLLSRFKIDWITCFRLNQDIVYDFTSQIHRTGSHSGCCN